MMQPRFLLFGSLLMLLAYEASASMTCDNSFGLLTCPNAFTSRDSTFCCTGPKDIPYCCDIGEYIQNNKGIIAGIVIGALVVFLLIPCLCCCCLCAACPLSRVRRGGVIVR